MLHAETMVRISRLETPLGPKKPFKAKIHSMNMPSEDDGGIRRTVSSDR